MIGIKTIALAPVMALVLQTACPTGDQITKYLELAIDALVVLTPLIQQNSAIAVRAYAIDARNCLNASTLALQSNDPPPVSICAGVIAPALPPNTSGEVRRSVLKVDSAIRKFLEAVQASSPVGVVSGEVKMKGINPVRLQRCRTKLGLP